MSISSAMLAGVAGLKANSAALAALSDNIANVNTVGYKRSQADFQTVVTSQVNGGSYSAGGMLAKTRQFVAQQGLLQRTNSGSDLGVAGNGFFVVTEKAEGLAPTDARLFTRAGSFQVDSQGFLRNSAGLYLQGWPADAEGQITTDPSDLNRLRTINVSGVGGVAEATTRVSLRGNLKDESGLPVSAEEGTYNTASNNMAMYDADTGAGVKPDFTMQIPISDSKGGKRTVQISFLRSDGQSNEWHAEVHAVPATDVAVGGRTDGVLHHGMVRFTQSGQYDAANSTLFPPNPDDPTALPLLDFGASGSTDGTYQWAAGLGVAEQTVRLDLGALTQFGGAPSEAGLITANGTAFGNLSNIEFDENGFVTAIFDNGVARNVGQVALATFPNSEGLRPASGNAYRVSLESGSYNLKAPGMGGSGYLSPSTLEASTVDLSQEFTGLITTQRAYSASSKIITTADQMLEELLMIKR